jgi:hypothetical protein
MCQANGTFATPAPTCTPNACPTLVAPANGGVTPMTGTTGTVATYSCNAGYALTGNATQTCQPAGTWSGTAPTCTMVTTGCTPDPCIHSMTGCMAADASGYTCGTCVVGWSGANCDVPVTCTGAIAPTNGTVSASSATNGNTVTYGCNSGYTLMGNATATCQPNGTFTGPAPTCPPADCGAPPVVANAAAPAVSGGAGGGNSTTFGATAAYTCNTGYTENGVNPTCGANGTWGTAPTCTPSRCGTYTDVVYHISGTFTVSQAPIAAANGSENVGATHPNTPAFTGAGDTTPFSTGTFTQGVLRLRFTNDATGNPAAGTVYLVEQYFPIYFSQAISALGQTGNLVVGVDSSLGMLTSGVANCGAGGTACTNVHPTISRPCANNASGTLSGTTLTWGACTPAPNGMTSWNYANGQAATGPGCATGFNQWGNIACTGSGLICGAIPAAELGDAYQTWNQALATATFSSTNYKTATLTTPASQIPNATGNTETTIAITKSTVVAAVCGSTPGTDLVCDVQ